MEASDHPLGAPAPTSASSNSYAFLRAVTDQPFVSYDPCRPIHYVVRPQNAPAGADQIITEAVAVASRATGFVFINDGATSEAPSPERAAYQLDRYGNRWAPVLFAWESRSEASQFTENWMPGSSTTLGLGGSMAITVDNQSLAYVTGQVRRMNWRTSWAFFPRLDALEAMAATLAAEGHTDAANETRIPGRIPRIRRTGRSPSRTPPGDLESGGTGRQPERRNTRYRSCRPCLPRTEGFEAATL